MIDKKELRYIKRLSELSRTCGLLLGIAEGLLLNSRIPIEIRMKVEKILIEVRGDLDKKASRRREVDTGR